MPTGRFVTAQRLALLGAVARLNPRQRAGIVLHYFHDYSLRAVGDALGTSEGGATMLVQRALDALRRVIDDDTGERRNTPEATDPKEAHGGRPFAEADKERGCAASLQPVPAPLNALTFR